MLLLDSCNMQKENFDRNFYEKSTNIKFPDKYKVVATADNGEFVTITILDIEKAECKKFSRDNNFKSVTESFIPNLFGLTLLDTAFQNLPDRDKLLENFGEKDKYNWVYLIDTAKCRVYCEISYPDGGGK